MENRDPPKRLTATIAEAELLREDVKRFVFSLSEPISFLPGQFVNLRFQGDTRFHAFSIASSPKEGGMIELYIKRVREFTTKLFAAEPGTELECMAPMGAFLGKELWRNDDLVMIAGGVGVTPFLSVLRWARDFHVVDRHVWLFLANRTRDRIVAEEELRALDALPNTHVVLSLTREEPDGWDGETGYFTRDVLERHLHRLDGKTFATCGPGRLVEAVCATLAEAGVPPERIKKESWG